MAINKIAFTIILMSISCSSLASKEMCKSVESAAESIMSLRMKNHSKEKMLNFANSIAAGHERESRDAVRNMSKALVVEAYNLPYFEDKKYQQRAINEFKTYYYIQCLKAIYEY